jgi:hypothetical protein
MLSNSELYHIWRERLTQLAPDAGACRTRLVNMMLLVVGLYKAESVHLSKVARKLPVRAKKLSLDKRLRRFLSNPRVRVRDWYRPVAVALLKAASSAGQIHLIIDSSKVGFGHQLLMVGIAYRRRALPLAWTWVRHRSGHSTAYKQVALLAYVHSLIPEGICVSLVGDSEFGSVDMLRQLDTWNWDYALRQRGMKRFLPYGMLTFYRLDRQKLKPGDKWWLGRVQLTYRFYITNLVLYRARGEPEPWYLATNLPSARGAILLYRRRMWLEEMFGDMKGHGFDLEATYLRHFLRLSRLTLAVCLLYLWLVATGERVMSDNLANEIDRTDRRDLSIFRIGWDFIERRLALDDPIPITFTPNFCSVSGG